MHPDQATLLAQAVKLSEELGEVSLGSKSSAIRNRPLGQGVSLDDLILEATRVAKIIFSIRGDCQDMWQAIHDATEGYLHAIGPFADQSAAVVSYAKNLTKEMEGLGHSSFDVANGLEVLARDLKKGHKTAATPVLWKYLDEDSGQEFFLTVRLPTVHSPFTGKSVPQRPEKYQLPMVQKELRQVGSPGAPAPSSEPGAPHVHWYPLAAQQELVTRASVLMDKLAAAAVLWKYVDSDSGQEFFLPSRRQNVHSPYTGKSVPQRPEKFPLAEVQKELRQESKGPAGAPGPKAGTPKAKPKKRSSNDPEWKLGLFPWPHGKPMPGRVHEIAQRELNEMRNILKLHGYDPRDAEKLHGEGMGPEELEHRIKTTRPGEMGSLEWTHGLKKAAVSA